MKKCLRCRKDAAEGYSFCEQCLKTVDVPLRESPYLNTQINLNTTKIRRVRATPVTVSAAKTEEKSNKGWKIATIILFLLCLLFAFGCAWFSRDLWLDYLR